MIWLDAIVEGLCMLLTTLIVAAALGWAMGRYLSRWRAKRALAKDAAALVNSSHWPT
jgi:hypothetical protein